jgi:hypothetical protein
MTCGRGTAHGLWTIELLTRHHEMRIARASAEVAAHYVVAEVVANAAKQRKHPR